MRVSQYMHAELAIVAAEAGGIRGRWLYGLRMLRDEQAMSPGGGGLRHGVGPQIVAEAKARGLSLSEREIRRRIQCAKAYPTEAQIGHAVADFGTWRDLHMANFPAYPAPDGEPLADHRTQSEKDRDLRRSLLDRIGEQGTLFPLDRYEPSESTVKELRDYALEQIALTERFAAAGRKRLEYVDALAAAVGGDMSVTWEAAHLAAFGGEPA